MPEKENVVTLVAVGDVVPKRHERPREVFDLTRHILKGADIAFGQLECNLTRRGMLQLQSFRFATGAGGGSSGIPLPLSLHPGRYDPDGAKALADAGFNIMSFASNHTMDWSEEGMLDTLEVLRSNNIMAMGCGRNIGEARQPAVIERKGTKVGFLAYSSVVRPGYDATEHQSGVAPMRASTSYEQFDWQPGCAPRVISQANPQDLAAMLGDIKKLRTQVDVLVVSMHWGLHNVPATIADYQFEVGHAAIDAGADLILGHHAHILKGIEVYKGKVIFFSLCNFSMGSYKPELTNKIGSHDSSSYPKFITNRHGYRVEVDPDNPDGGNIDAKKTIIVKCVIDNKKLQRVAYLPVWINKIGQPEPLSRSDPRSDQVFNYINWIDGHQGIESRFSREGDEIVVVT